MTGVASPDRQRSRISPLSEIFKVFKCFKPFTRNFLTNLLFKCTNFNILIHHFNDQAPDFLKFATNRSPPNSENNSLAPPIFFTKNRPSLQARPSPITASLSSLDLLLFKPESTINISNSYTTKRLELLLQNILNRYLASPSFYITTDNHSREQTQDNLRAAVPFYSTYTSPLFNI